MIRDEVVSALLGRPKFGTGTGLHRMSALAALLPPAPWLGTGCALHVTGSHGKGSVALLTAALLRANGARVGLFESPHLHRFEERIRIDGVPIAPDALVAAYHAYAEAERCVETEAGRFGSFEAITGTALFAFAAAGVDTVVMEAGIGGRFDSTRVAGGALVALSAVDREHLDLLGPTERHVLRQKADLTPRGGTLFAGRLTPDLRADLEAYAHAQGFEARFVHDEVEIADVQAHEHGVTVDLRLDECRLPRLETRLFGHVQLGNAALALLLARAWLERFDLFDTKRFETAARATFARTSLPLRFQRVAQAPPVYADVAHTPGAVQALANTVRLHLGSRPIITVLGVSEGKVPVEITAGLAPISSRILCTMAGHRAMNAEALARSLSDIGAPVEAEPDLAAALARAQRLAKARNGAVLVTGSLFVARDAERLLRGTEGPADGSL